VRYIVVMQFTIPHHTTKDKAKSKITEALAQARAQAGTQATFNEERWDGDTLYFDVTAQGQRISGTIAVDDTTFDINAKLPLLMRPFEGRIKAMLEQQMGGQ